MSKVYTLTTHYTDGCHYWYDKDIIYSRNSQQLESICDKLNKKREHDPEQSYSVGEIDIKDSLTKVEMNDLIINEVGSL